MSAKGDDDYRRKEIIEKERIEKEYSAQYIARTNVI